MRCQRKFRMNKTSIYTCINTNPMQRKSCTKGEFSFLSVLGYFASLCSYLPPRKCHTKQR